MRQYIYVLIHLGHVLLCAARRENGRHGLRGPRPHSHLRPDPDLDPDLSSGVYIPHHVLQGSSDCRGIKRSMTVYHHCFSNCRMHLTLTQTLNLTTLIRMGGYDCAYLGHQHW